MKITTGECIACEACVPYCPVDAISMKGDAAVIGQDECVDCAVCLKSESCPVDCIAFGPALWPSLLTYRLLQPEDRAQDHGRCPGVRDGGTDGHGGEINPSQPLNKGGRLH